MRILGLDLSITSSGMCVMDVQPDFTVSNVSLYGFTKTQKWPYDGKNLKIIQLPKDYDKHPSHYRPKIVYDLVEQYLTDIDYVSIEDYAFAATGKVFDLAEFAGGMKEIFYNRMIPMKKLPPITVKQCATGNHMADKILMGLYFRKTNILNMIDSYIFDLPEHESPQEDIIDAYYMAEVFRAELCYRTTGKFPTDMNLSYVDSMKAIVTGSASTKTQPAIEHPIIRFGEFSRVKKKIIEKKAKKSKKNKEVEPNTVKAKVKKEKLVVAKKTAAK